MLMELFLFTLLFIVFPFGHASGLHQKILKANDSPTAVYIYSCLLTVAVNCLLLAGEYALLPKYSDSVYLTSIISMNALIFFLFSFSSYSSFKQSILTEIKRNGLLKLPIVFSILALAYTIILIRPFGSDLMDYYQIGKLLYQKKALIYQGMIVNENNAFSAHVFHPPFYTLVLSLGHIIQGSADYFRVNNYISAYYSVLFLSMMLVLMRKKYLLGFCVLIFSLLTSVYACTVFILPNGLDPFRFSYFLLAFALLNTRIKARTTNTLILFALSLATCLAVHSSGLLFTLLILIIYLASYVEHSIAKKYMNVLTIALIAFALGGIQYAVNLYHIGKPISDTLPIWDNFNYQHYMRFERNLFSIEHMLHVIFNQFFAFDKSTYGYLFFLALCLGVLNIKSYFLELKQAFLNCLAIKQKPLQAYSEHFLFILGFYSVVLISIFANQELIVKNFRYLFTVYPSIILFVYAALERFTIKKLLHWKNKSLLLVSHLYNRILLWGKSVPYTHFIFLGLGIGLSGLLFKYMRVSYGVYSFTPSTFQAQNKNQNLNHLMPGMGDVVHYISQNISPPQSILAFDNAQLYQFFPSLKIYTHLDDRLLSLYQFETPDDLYHALKKQQIEGIFVSYYRPSILMQSQFSKLLADPKYVTLAVHKGNYLFYRLNHAPQKENATKPVKKLTSSLGAGSSQMLELDLAEKKQFVIKIVPEQEGTFYQISARTIYQPIAYYTYDGASEFLFSTADIKKEIGDKLSLMIHSKNNPITLNITIRELS